MAMGSHWVMWMVAGALARLSGVLRNRGLEYFDGLNSENLAMLFWHMHKGLLQVWAALRNFDTDTSQVHPKLRSQWQPLKN